MKYYGYRNYKTNVMLNITKGGRWVEVNFFMFIWLAVTGVMVKSEIKGG